MGQGPGQAGQWYPGAKSRVLVMVTTCTTRCHSPVHPSNPEGGPPEGTVTKKLRQDSRPGFWLREALQMQPWSPEQEKQGEPCLGAGVSIRPGVGTP